MRNLLTATATATATLIATPAVSTANPANELPNDVSAAAADLIAQLERPSGAYSMTKYLVDLRALGSRVNPELRKELVTVRRNPSPHADLAVLAFDAMSDEQMQRVEELGEWYGRLEKDIPFEMVEDRVRQMYERVGFAYDRATGKDWWENRHKGNLTKGYEFEVEKLHDEHATAEYVTAWKVWLIAPDDTQRRVMSDRLAPHRDRPVEALLKAGDASLVPFLEGAYRIAFARSASGKDKFRGTGPYLRMIDAFPSAAALDALLRFNRFAIAEGLPVEGVMGSARIVTRLFASYPGYNERHPEAGNPFPRTNDNWKTYKPLIEARLAAAESGEIQVPAPDLAIMKAALELMPQGSAPKPE